MKTALITQGCSSYHWAVLTQHHGCFCFSHCLSPASRLEVHRRLGGGTAETADPNGPKGYSLPHETVISNKNWGASLPELLNCSFKIVLSSDKEKLYCGYFFMPCCRMLKAQNSPAMDLLSFALLLYLNCHSALLFWCAWKSFSYCFLGLKHCLLPYCDFMLI